MVNQIAVWAISFHSKMKIDIRPESGLNAIIVISSYLVAVYNIVENTFQLHKTGIMMSLDPSSLCKEAGNPENYNH